MVETLRHSKDRLDAVIAEAEKLLESEFPYSCSSEALRVIERKLRDRKAILEKLDIEHDKKAIQTACSQTLKMVIQSLPFLGFILRSTNVRNAFEIYGPLRRLCACFMGGDVRLVISSEWEEYSPFAKISRLLPDNYVLIAFPAPESSNPLIVPLAGHEIGHAVWAQRLLEPRFNKEVVRKIAAYFKTHYLRYREIFPAGVGAAAHEAGNLDDLDKVWVDENVRGSANWALRQIEEYFCDAMGVRLFAEAYLHAFAYLFSPTPNTKRPEKYPNMDKRVENIVKAADRFGVSVAPGYEGWFTKFVGIEPKFVQRAFLSEAADAIAADFCAMTHEIVEELCEHFAAPSRSNTEVARIVKSFKNLVPPSGRSGLTDIINAGWVASSDEKMWEAMPAAHARRGQIVREIVLKTIEVNDVYELMEEYDDIKE